MRYGGAKKRLLNDMVTYDMCVYDAIAKQEFLVIYN